MKDDRTPAVLVSVAKRIFATKGFAGTTVREIAKQAGVNLSLVSYHFDGKEGLYRACVAQFTEARLADAQRVLQVPASREEFRLRLKIFISEFLRSYAEEPEVSLMIQREIETEGEMIADIFSKTLLTMAQTLKDYLLHGKEQGWVRPDLEPKVAMAAVFGSMVHSMRMDRITEKFFHVSIRQAEYRELFCNQLAGIILDGVSNTESSGLSKSIAGKTPPGTFEEMKERLQP